MPAATVVCPTFDHGPTLRYSLASALAQTVSDIELFVVGDGVPEVTREIVAEFARNDERVRFFDNPKGERHGEAHRRQAIEEARSDRILYLSDDDLWLPDHVRTLLGALESSDWAHTIPAWVVPEGEMGVNIVDLADSHYRDRMLHDDFPPSPGLSQTGHTRELYDALPEGWRPAPAGVPTDLYMWRQILSLPWVRPRSVPAFTVLGLPSPARRGWDAERRADELAGWAAELSAPEGRLALERRVLATFAQRAAWEDKHATLARHALEEELARERERANQASERGLVRAVARRVAASRSRRV
ncbi:MAG: glycosyltransferase family 2 protein [Thermoleophilaceae bacterium]